jgi:hypothetical protein
LRGNTADALDEALALYGAVRIGDRLADFRFHFVNLGMVHARLLSDVHRTSAHDGTTASAGT